MDTTSLRNAYHCRRRFKHFSGFFLVTIYKWNLFYLDRNSRVTSRLTFRSSRDLCPSATRRGRCRNLNIRDKKKKEKITEQKNEADLVSSYEGVGAEWRDRFYTHVYCRWTNICLYPLTIRHKFDQSLEMWYCGNYCNILSFFLRSVSSSCHFPSPFFFFIYTDSSMQ